VGILRCSRRVETRPDGGAFVAAFECGSCSECAEADDAMPIAREESGAVLCSSSSADHREAVAADSVADRNQKRDETIADESERIETRFSTLLLDKRSSVTDAVLDTKMCVLCVVKMKRMLIANTRLYLAAIFAPRI
jgi:hypothetical protein